MTVSVRAVIWNQMVADFLTQDREEGAPPLKEPINQWVQSEYIRTLRDPYQGTFNIEAAKLETTSQEGSVFPQLITTVSLTGRDELDAKMRGFNLGAVDYITKPFQVLEVLARVRLHLKLSLATNYLISSQAEKIKQIQDAQNSILVAPEDLPEACFSVCYKSFLEAGGDFYDVLQISDGIYGYFVGDVSGHDIATSYMTSAVKALLKQNCVPAYEPVETIRMINNVLVEILPDGKYMTACYAKLNHKTKRITIVNCGHPPVVYLPEKGNARFIEIEGDVLGIFRDGYSGRHIVRVNKGDRFFLYTDGLIERPEQGKVWTEGLDDLLKACNDLKHIPISESADRLVDMMLGNGAKSEDDIVVVGVEV